MYQNGDSLPFSCCLCGDALFCSKKCVFNGLSEHYDDGCKEKEKLEKEINERELMTPRSVLNNVFIVIKRSPALQEQLKRKLKSDELSCLVIRGHSAEDICTLLNNCQDTNSVLLNMATVESCSSLMDDPCMEPLWQIRLLRNSEKMSLLGIQVGKETVVYQWF